MNISKHAQRDARQLFRSCLVDGLLDEGRVRLAVKLVLERRPRGYLGMLSRLIHLVKFDMDRRSVRVESAVTLADDLRSDIAKRLGEIYGDGLSMSFSVNPALIGGLRVQIGSDLYDGSVKNRLVKLEQSF